MNTQQDELSLLNSKENIPNAAKLVNSLRHLDYDDVFAICDIVDNSVDASSQNIWIEISGTKDGINKVVVADDGTGMDVATLDQAMRLGSDTDKNELTDLGKFGMGLITASISLGLHLDVITTQNSEAFFKGSQDLDEIMRENQFLKHLAKLEVPQANEFIERRKLRAAATSTAPASSGTEVTLSKIDRVKFTYAEPLRKELARQLGQIYRKFIQAKKFRMFIDGKEVAAIDPIGDFKNELLMEEVLSLPEGNLSIRIYELEDQGKAINTQNGFSIANQGFYVLRNNREILSGETLDVFTKHNDLNVLRIELNYPATLDSAFSTNFSKRRLALSQSIKDKITRICNPYIAQVRNRAKKRQNTSTESQPTFSEIEKHITQKSHLLRTPAAEIEERNPKAEKEKQEIRDTIKEHGPRVNITKRKRVDTSALRVSFRTKELGAKGPLYEPDMEKDVVIIYWNIEHPFYQEVIAPSSQNADVFSAVAFLVYSLAAAELTASRNSQNLEVLEHIRYDVGINLAVLLQS